MRSSPLRSTKCFSVLRVQALVIFQNHAHIQYRERSPSECMPSEMSQLATNRQESPLTFGTRKSVVLGVSTSLEVERSVTVIRLEEGAVFVLSCKFNEKNSSVAIIF